MNITEIKTMVESNTKVITEIKLDNYTAYFDSENKTVILLNTDFSLPSVEFDSYNRPSINTPAKSSMSIENTKVYMENVKISYEVAELCDGVLMELGWKFDSL